MPKRQIKSIDELEDRQSIKDKVSKMLSAYRCKDKKKGLECTITNEELYNIITTECCEYCGSRKNIGLDRIDNKKGHTLDNCVPCCYLCNVVRGDNFSHDEMLEIGKLIRKIVKKRNENITKKNS